jgi:hypothetical protein
LFVCFLSCHLPLFKQRHIKLCIQVSQQVVTSNC